MTIDMPVLSSLVTYHRVCNKSNTTGATSEAPPLTLFLVGFVVFLFSVDLFVLWLAIALSVPRFKAFDYPLGIFNFFLFQ